MSVSWNLFIFPTYYTPLSYRTSYSLILMQNISEVLATYARTIHTIELHSKSPAAYHPIPYKLSSFAAYIAKRFISCTSSHFARISPNSGRAAMSFLIAWAYEDSSRPCAQLTLQHIALPRNSLQALLPHHLHRPLLLQLRFPPLFKVLGHLGVFIHHRMYHRKGLFEDCTQFLCPWGRVCREREAG